MPNIKHSKWVTKVDEFQMKNCFKCTEHQLPCQWTYHTYVLYIQSSTVPYSRTKEELHNDPNGNYVEENEKKIIHIKKANETKSNDKIQLIIICHSLLSIPHQTKLVNRVQYCY